MAQKVEIQIGLNSRGFVVGLDQARKSVASFITGLGRSTFGQFVGAQGFLNLISSVKNFVSETASAADDIKDVAELFGGDTNLVQRLKFDAEDAGASFEKLQASMGKLAEARQAAMEGKPGKADAFAFFGIALSELESMNPAQLFQRIRESVSAMNAEMASSAELLTKLKDVGFNARQLELLRTPDTGSQTGVMDEAQLKRFEEMRRSMNRGTRSFKGFGRDILDAAGEGPIKRGAFNLPGDTGGTKWDELLTLGFSRMFKGNAGRRSPFAKLLGFEDAEPMTGAMMGFETFDKRRKAEAQTEKAKAELLDMDVQAGLDEMYRDIAKQIVEENKAAAKGVASTARASTKVTDQASVQSTATLDAMAQMGAFVGGAVIGNNPALRVQQDQLTTQMDMNNKLTEIAANTRSGTSGTIWS